MHDRPSELPHDAGSAEMASSKDFEAPLERVANVTARFGSASRSDPRYEAIVHLGRLRRTVFPTPHTHGAGSKLTGPSDRRPASLQAVIWRVRRDCAGPRAVNCALPNTLKHIFHNFAAAGTSMIYVGQKINCPDRRVAEHENRVNEMIVLKGRRNVTAIYQFTIFERTAVKLVAAQFNALVAKGLILVVVFHALNSSNNISGKILSLVPDTFHGKFNWLGSPSHLDPPQCRKTAE